MTSCPLYNPGDELAKVGSGLVLLDQAKEWAEVKRWPKIGERSTHITLKTPT